MSGTDRNQRPSNRTFDSEQHVLAGRIREARLEAGIGLREFARRVGCSAGLISKIEHEEVLPSVSTLYAIARELHVPIDILFASDGHGSATKKRSSGGVSVAYNLVRSRGTGIRLPHGVEWRRLATGNNSIVEFREIIYHPGAMTVPKGQMLQHQGHEHGMVIDGCFMVQLGDDVLKLWPGDSVAFGAQVPHRLWNPGPDMARAVWIIQVE